MLLAGLALLVADCFLPGAALRAVREGLDRTGASPWQQRIAIHGGVFTLDLVRLGLNAVPLDPQARAALQAVRSADVGVYQLRPGDSPPARASMLAAADTAMRARNWERMVGVLDAGNLVAIYLPAKAPSPRKVTCCVLAYDGRHLVVVSVRADPRPLVRLALSQPALGGPAKYLAQR